MKKASAQQVNDESQTPHQDAEVTFLGVAPDNRLLLYLGPYMLNWFKYYDVQLSPEVVGHIVKNGEPLEGVAVYREVLHAKHYMTRTTTDADGRFAFPPKTIQSREPGKLFGVEHITHSITADHGDQTYLLWRYTKSTRQPEQVISEKLGGLFCDLNNPEQLHHFRSVEHPSFTHNIRGVCHWPSSPPIANSEGAKSRDGTRPSQPPLE